MGADQGTGLLQIVQVTVGVMAAVFGAPLVVVAALSAWIIFEMSHGFPVLIAVI